MSKHYRAAFKWREMDNVPVAAVTVLNGRGWLLCCPLCGCIHETRMAQTTGAYAPDCLLRRLANMAQPVGRPAEYGANWARVLQLWQDAHPAARAHDTVLLLDAEAVAALDAAQQQADRLAAAQARRDERSSAARAKRAAAGKTRGRPRKDVAGKDVAA